MRQGDPLSPFLFILGAEVLSRLILRQERNRSIHGIKISRSAPPISHLLFADDFILFSRANKDEAETLKECLQTYCSWSGQALNERKSAISFSKNAPRDKKGEIRAILNLRNLASDSKHLGLPMLFRKSKTSTFREIKEKVFKKRSGWKAKILSQAGRTTLIKAVASSLPAYSMSTFLLPKGFCSSIDKALKDFWWGFKEDKRHNYTPKSWSSICRPKSKGGLGIRKLHEYNKALLSKLSWDICLNSEKLWVRAIAAKYLRRYTFMQAEAQNDSSWFWKGLLQTNPRNYPQGYVLPGAQRTFYPHFGGPSSPLHSLLSTSCSGRYRAFRPHPSCFGPS